MQLDWLWAILGPIFVFGLVIFVHELGHFLAAKWAGVYTPRFSIGFGAPLWKRRWGETEYVLAALPLGGYVRMASRQDEEVAFLEGGSEESGAAEPERTSDWDPEALKPFGPKPVPEHRYFESKPLAKRLVIMTAGVTMNVVLALVVSIGLLWSYGRSYIATRVVGAVQPVSAAPSLTDAIAPGDTILAVNGRAVRSWSEIQQALFQSRGDTLSVRTHRGEALIPIARGSAAREELIRAIEFHVPPVIDSVLPGRPAARGGLRAGDSIVAVNGEPVTGWSEVVSRVNASSGPLSLEIERSGARHSITVEPESTATRDEATGAAVSRRQIGAMSAPPVAREPYGIGEAIVGGWKMTWDMADAVIGVVRGLFVREVKMDQLAGPIGIVRLSATAAQLGLEPLLRFLAFLSINLAVLNLLPIPILDGGQILLNVIESARGSAFSDRTREYILRAGLLAIALLFVVVMFNDIKRLWVDHIAPLLGIA